MTDAARAIDYTVKKHGLRRQDAVDYKCPGCGEEIWSPLEKAGQSDECPQCGAQFIVPGVDVLNKRRDYERQKQIQEEERRQKLKEQRDIVVARPVRVSQPESSKAPTHQGASPANRSTSRPASSKLTTDEIAWGVCKGLWFFMLTAIAVSVVALTIAAIGYGLLD